MAPMISMIEIALILSLASISWRTGCNPFTTCDAQCAHYIAVILNHKTLHRLACYLGFASLCNKLTGRG